MNQVYDKLMNCYEQMREKVDFKPEVALILGSGLGDYAKDIRVVQTLDYDEIEGFPVSTVQGHAGRFVFGYVEDVPVVAMQGRVHYYEGYAMTDVVLPCRLMRLMGAKVLFLTNAAGGVNLQFQAGDLMLITDQISSLVPSPLLGENLDEFGPRFCDMVEIYDKDLREIIEQCASEHGIALQKGVYLQLTGPNYESPAEVRMVRTLGADAVGMSTACEAVAANHMGMKICGITCITNMAAGITGQALSHEEVQETADKAAAKFKNLVTQSIVKIHNYIL